MKKFITATLYRTRTALGLILFLFCFIPANVEAGTIVRAATNQSLVGYWTFDKDDLKVSALDRSGLGNNGVLSGFTSTSTATVVGRMGQALKFDGSNDQVNINPIANRVASGAFSVSLWFNPASTFTGANRQILFLMGDFSSDNDVRICLGGTPSDSCNSPTGQLCLGLYTGGGWADACASQTTWPAGAWVHVVGTFSTTGGQRLYVNAAQAGTHANTSRGSTVTNQASLGYNPIGGVDAFYGSIDDVRVYTRALTAAEVTTLYGATAAQRTRVATNDGLVGYWSFEEGMGTRAGDMSGKGSHGTLQGGMGNTNWVPGKRGTALSFDGSDDYIDAPIPSPAAYTFAGWFYTRSFTSGLSTDASGTYFVDRQLANNALASLKAIGGNFSHQYRQDSGTNLGAVSGGTIMLKKWQFVAWGKHASGVPFIFVDGALTNAGVTLGTVTLDDIRIGIHQSLSSVNAFNGIADDIRMYNRALTLDEIKAIYDEGAVTRTNVTRTPLGLEKGLVGHWTFDGQDVVNTTAYDKSGSGNTGTLTNGPVRTIGRIGQALQFDGNDDTVLISNESNFDFERTQSFSVCTWINPSSVSEATQRTLVSKLVTSSPFTGWEFNQYDPSGNNNGLHFYAINTFVSNTLSVSKSGILSAGVWQHACVVYRGTSSSTGVTFYVNGTGYAPSTAHFDSLSATILNNVAPSIGARTSSLPYKGGIDDVRIYNRALSADEVKQLYNLGR